MMGSMTDNETYNGYSNRETWAFNLHWQNDEGMYRMVLEAAQDYIDGRMVEDPDRVLSDSELGEATVIYVRELLEEHMTGVPTDGTDMMYREVGSWWRIDYREVGEAVREALGIESD